LGANFLGSREDGEDFFVAGLLDGEASLDEVIRADLVLNPGLHVTAFGVSEFDFSPLGGVTESVGFGAEEGGEFSVADHFLGELLEGNLAGEGNLFTCTDDTGLDGVCSSRDSTNERIPHDEILNEAFFF